MEMPVREKKGESQLGEPWVCDSRLISTEAKRKDVGGCAV